MQEPASSSPLPAHWQQTDRLATIGTLTAGIAHELNNPIGYILSNLTSFQLYLPIFRQYFALLQALAVTDEPQARTELKQELADLQSKEDLQFLLNDTQSLLADSLQGALRVRDLVLDLRRFSHPDHAEFQQLDMHPLLEMALRLSKNELKNHIVVELNCSATPALVYGQPAALTQVLVNIIINAAQAMGPDTGLLRLTVIEQSDWLEIRIEDNGPGISDDVLPHIFTPFFTTKAPGKGTGLGLAICQSIIQQHQGDITVGRSVLGGAAFKLRLPSAKATATADN